MAPRRVTRDRHVSALIVDHWSGPAAVALSRSFRFGTPLLVALCALGAIRWWLAFVPVIPVWIDFVTDTHLARRRVRMVHKPTGSMGLSEAAAERRSHSAVKAFHAAAAQRDVAFADLARERAKAAHAMGR